MIKCFSLFAFVTLHFNKLIFSYTMQDFLELRKYSYERLDGSIRAEERFAAIRSFSTQSTKKGLKSQPDQNGAFVFMISTRAGGVGLNLVAADTVSFGKQSCTALITITYV